MRLLRRNALAVYGTYAAAIVSGLVVTPIVVHSVAPLDAQTQALIQAFVPKQLGPQAAVAEVRRFAKGSVPP